MRTFLIAILTLAAAPARGNEALRGLLELAEGFEQQAPPPPVNKEVPAAPAPSIEEILAKNGLVVAAGASKRDKVKAMFDAAKTVPSQYDLTGWFAGEGYSDDKPNDAQERLLIGYRMHDLNQGGSIGAKKEFKVFSQNYAASVMTPDFITLLLRKLNNDVSPLYTAPQWTGAVGVKFEQSYDDHPKRVSIKYEARRLDGHLLLQEERSETTPARQWIEMLRDVEQGTPRVKRVLAAVKALPWVHESPNDVYDNFYGRPKDEQDRLRKEFDKKNAEIIAKNDVYIYNVAMRRGSSSADGINMGAPVIFDKRRDKKIPGGMFGSRDDAATAWDDLMIRERVELGALRIIMEALGMPGAPTRDLVDPAKTVKTTSYSVFSRNVTPARKLLRD